MVVGVPDLYCIAPGYMPVLLEAKWMGDITAHNFNRKIPYSAMQKVWIKAACKVQDYAAMGLIGFKFRDQTWCVLMEEGIENINYAFGAWHPCVTYDKGFDIQALFGQSLVPKMPLTYAKLCANENIQLKLVSRAVNDT